MNIGDIYRGLEKKSCIAMEALLADGESLTEFTKANNLVAEYRALKNAVANRHEAHLMDLASKEYESSLLALATSSYRSAFSSLRLSLELNIASVYFSAHEIDYHLWLQKAKDIQWGTIANKETGVLSDLFSTAFNSDLADERKHYQNLAATVYRECSEYVHGNAHTHENIPTEISFHKDILKLWCGMADTILLVVVFAFSMRYLRYLNKTELGYAEPIVMDKLGHISSIQTVFQLTK
ncbi:hypothetical protein FP568_09515 [Pandoraea pnomenusa]|uniref:hypothetical protein n=1 Tax=Pandoraea pnomenusa TaxID=93220 RepID=UPI00119865F3|nr:hypothetical protein [Pandoraea pnomenusa]QDX21465.1 hypothetical protein FP568_09515 [Pandoraea pnomenusa]